MILDSITQISNISWKYLVKHSLCATNLSNGMDKYDNLEDTIIAETVGLILMHFCFSVKINQVNIVIS